jgi:hypothetical protein
MPRQDEIRGVSGALGTPFGGSWNYQDIVLSDGYLRVADALWIGDVIAPPVNSELHIKEGGFSDNTHPRITMEDRNGLGFVLEMDAQAGNNMHFYFPCIATEPNDGMFMAVSTDQEMRFFSNVVINEVGGGADPAAMLAIRRDTPTRTLDVNGDTMTNTLILTPINPANITSAKVNGMMVSDSTDANRLKRYNETTATWQSPAADATVNGTYNGNGAASLAVTLGFRPKYLQIVANVGAAADVAIFTKYDSMPSGAAFGPTNIAIASGVGVADQWRQSCIEITNTGFIVYKGSFGNINRDTNLAGETYHYIAQR